MTQHDRRRVCCNRESTDHDLYATLVRDFCEIKSHRFFHFRRRFIVDALLRKRTRLLFVFINYPSAVLLLMRQDYWFRVVYCCLIKTRDHSLPSPCLLIANKLRIRALYPRGKYIVITCFSATSSAPARLLIKTSNVYCFPSNVMTGKHWRLLSVRFRWGSINTRASETFSALLTGFYFALISRRAIFFFPLPPTIKEIFS